MPLVRNYLPEGSDGWITTADLRGASASARATASPPSDALRREATRRLSGCAQRGLEEVNEPE